MFGIAASDFALLAMTPLSLRGFGDTAENVPDVLLPHFWHVSKSAKASGYPFTPPTEVLFIITFWKHANTMSTGTIESIIAASTFGRFTPDSEYMR